MLRFAVGSGFWARRRKLPQVNKMNKHFVNTLRCCNTNIRLVRNASSTSGKGVKYYGFTYFPRHPEKADPPCQPSKLFLVQRIKPVKGNPHWEKKILKEFKLDGKMSDVAILKNIPENNSRLWQIKHLIKITPITFPNGVPTNEDAGATFLKDNGEFLVSPTIKVEPERLEAREEYYTNVVKVDGATLRNRLRLNWLNPW